MHLTPYTLIILVPQTGRIWESWQRSPGSQRASEFPSHKCCSKSCGVRTLVGNTVDLQAHSFLSLLLPSHCSGSFYSIDNSCLTDKTWLLQMRLEHTTSASPCRLQSCRYQELTSDTTRADWGQAPWWGWPLTSFNLRLHDKASSHYNKTPWHTWNFSSDSEEATTLGRLWVVTQENRQHRRCTALVVYAVRWCRASSSLLNHDKNTVLVCSCGDAGQQVLLPSNLTASVSLPFNCNVSNESLGM